MPTYRIVINAIIEESYSEEFETKEEAEKYGWDLIRAIPYPTTFNEDVTVYEEN